MVQVYFLTKGEGGRSRPVISGYIQQIFSATWNISCRLDLPSEKDMLMPGDHATVYLTLLKKMVVEPGQSFTIRENNVCVATGIITDTMGTLPLPKDNLSYVKINH